MAASSPDGESLVWKTTPKDPFPTILHCVYCRSRVSPVIPSWTFSRITSASNQLAARQPTRKRKVMGKLTSHPEAIEGIRPMRRHAGYFLSEPDGQCYRILEEKHGGCRQVRGSTLGLLAPAVMGNDLGMLGIEYVMMRRIAKIEGASEKAGPSTEAMITVRRYDGCRSQEAANLSRRQTWSHRLRDSESVGRRSRLGKWSVSAIDVSQVRVGGPPQNFY